jgi:hypothetical protein
MVLPIIRPLMCALIIRVEKKRNERKGRREDERKPKMGKQKIESTESSHDYH